MARRIVAIVGGGFSGTMLALHLLRASDSRIQILLIEKGAAFGRGVAYSSRQPGHLLNVRAGNMSAYPDRPAHFQDWLASQTGEQADPFSFAPRWVYGDYLQAELRKAAQSSRAANRLQLIQDEVVDLERSGRGVMVRLAIGRTLQVDTVVMATGHGGAHEPVSSRSRFAGNPLYIDDPWRPESFNAIEPADRVLLLGTGLTAVDVIADLDSRGHRGLILAISRRGLSPQRHARFQGDPVEWKPAPNERMSQALRRFRRSADRLTDWRRAFDGLRPIIQPLWSSLDEAERRRFLRHLRPWWDIHRHRMAPEMAARIDARRSSGRLRIEAGRVLNLTHELAGVTFTWRPRGSRTLRADRAQWVVNCTGAEGDPRQSGSILVRRLIERGLARPDPLNLGLDADGEGRLLSATGLADPSIYGIGPITRGALWETIAVPDIRVQAVRIAEIIAATAGSTGIPSALAS